MMTMTLSKQESGALSGVARRIKFAATFPVRFWSKIDKDGPIPMDAPDLGPCWMWTGSRHKFGYGKTKRLGEDLHAHRVAYELTNGTIDVGLWVLHRCDNPPCCNPAHLRLGTTADNNRDMTAKDRHARGERNPAAKLTDLAVLEIRRRFAAGDTKKGLARHFGVSDRLIFNVVNRIKWIHIPPEHDDEEMSP